MHLRQQWMLEQGQDFQVLAKDILRVRWAIVLAIS